MTTPKEEIEIHDTSEPCPPLYEKLKEVQEKDNTPAPKYDPETGTGGVSQYL